MKQLLLDLALPTPWTFEEFVPGENAEALHFVAMMTREPLPEYAIYLWGDKGAGKTHLLRAAIKATQKNGHTAQYLDCACDSIVYPLPGCDLLAIDNVMLLNDSQQIVIFDHYNTMKEQGRNLLFAGDLPPMLLPLRPDLTTRLGWGLVYELKGLSDEDKRLALQTRAQHLGFILTDEQTAYLLRHASRDMPSLMTVLTVLDQLALAKHRQITLPLLKDALQEGNLCA
jgi:DnaA family protein